MKLTRVFLILLISCLSTFVTPKSDAELRRRKHKAREHAREELLKITKIRDYSNGTAPKYFDETWVKKTLECAGLRTEDENVSEQRRIHELIPITRGIPGRGNTCDTFNTLMQKPNNKAEYDHLRSRAGKLDPPIPWMVLALYHRGMLGQPRYDWAEARKNKKEMLKEMNKHVILRFDELVTWGNLTSESWVIDAGCGWGRFGRQLISYLEPPGQYMGVELDEFELRAFIQLELGIEQPVLAQKNPVILHSGEFDFETLLRQSNEKQSRPGSPPRLADMVIFSSVLKSNIPRSVRRMAFCHAAHALKKNGKAIIFTDCRQKELESIVEEVGGFGPLIHTGFESCYFERKSIIPVCRDEHA